MRKTVKILALILAMFMLASCTSQPAANVDNSTPPSQGSEAPASSSEPSGSGEMMKIGACPADPSVAFFSRLGEGFEAGGELYGAEVDVQFTDRSIEKEISLTDTYIAQGFDAVIMDTVDSAAVTGPAQRAAENGVLFACADTIPDEPDLMTVTVSSDNEGGGVACGELMKKYLPEGGQIIMVTFMYSSRTMDGRYDGFRSAIEGSGIEIVEEVATDGSREDAMAKITPILSKYPDLKGIYCTQGDPAVGVLSAVEGAGLQDKIKIVTFDVDDELADLIRNDSAIVAGVAQFPYEIGLRTIKELVNAYEGKEVSNDGIVLLPILPVEKDTVDEFQADSTAYLEKYSDYRVD